MNRKALWNAKRVMINHERKPAGYGHTLQRAFVVAGAIVGVFFLLGAVVSPVCAQTYPDKPLRIILPYPPGGATDILGRLVGQKLAERLGQPVVPENRPGAGGNIGTEVVAKARPDGYTILFASPSMTISATLYKNLNYDATKDLAPISIVMEGDYVLLVRPSLPVKNLKELVAYAKARPGKVTYGGGIGTPPHLAGELLNTLGNIKMLHVPYKGVNQAMIGMMGNEIDMVVIGTPAALPQIRAGKVRPLAVLSKKRLSFLPNVPTTAEAGIEHYEVTSWYGIMAPAGTPGEIIARLNSEWVKMAGLPDTKEKAAKFGFEPVSGTPGQFGQFIKSEIVRWGKVIKDANLSAN